MSAAQHRLLARYCDAFDRHDVETRVSLLHEDATMAMPPFGLVAAWPRRHPPGAPRTRTTV